MSFPFSFWKTAAGGGGGTPPAWEGEIASRFYALSSAGTSVITTTADVLVGERVVIVASTYLQAGQSLSSVTDSAGNTYTVDKSYLFDTSKQIFFASSRVASQLSSGGTITLTWASPANNYRWAVVGKISNAAAGAADANQHATGSGASPSASASTVATNTVCVGTIYMASQSRTYGSSAWDMMGAVYDPGASTMRSYYFTEEPTSAAAQDPAGTITGGVVVWGMAWVSYS